MSNLPLKFYIQKNSCLKGGKSQIQSEVYQLLTRSWLSIWDRSTRKSKEGQMFFRKNSIGRQVGYECRLKGIFMITFKFIMWKNYYSLFCFNDNQLIIQIQSIQKINLFCSYLLSSFNNHNLFYSISPLSSLSITMTTSFSYFIFL